ncbi:hypothetical protein ACLKA6_007318 [Drosophila palustris]
MTATLDTGATRSFISEDCMRRWAIQGETQAMQTRIRLADGSTLEVGRLLRVDVGMAGKVVNMPMLIMSSLMDHILLGMDFLCAMGATVRCGDAELVLGTVGATAAEPAGPAGRAGEPPRGVPSGGEKGPTRRGRRRRDGRTPGSSRRPSPGRGGTTEESRTQAAQPNSGLAATMAENEAAASVGVQAEGGEAAPRETSPRGVGRPRLAGSGSPSARVMVEDMEDGEGESPDEEAEWSEDLEPELKGFLEAELALFEGLQGVSHIAEHKIRLKDDKPLKQRYYPKNPAMQRVIDEQVNELIQAGAIEPSRSPHSAPIVLVKKKTGDWRMCIDYRQLNAHSIPDAYPVPRINHILERLRHARFISTLDLKQGYWQIPMAADSRECTAFTVPGRGLFQWRVMPFGLHSACATFQRALDTVIGPEMEPHAFAYLDDIVVIGATKEQHVENLREVFRRLRAANLKLNRKKCSFFRKRLVYLGHVISGEGICTDPEKVEAIRSLRAPANCKELRQCLGMASWYRRFVPNFATLVRPMTELLKKGRKWSWDKEQEEALSQLKEKLTTAPVLACPDFSARFVLQTDASDYGLGAVLTQTVDGQERWVELIPLKRATAALLQTAFRERILSRFGVPKTFVCDNGVQFTSRNFQAFLVSLGIEVQHTAPYCPQENPTERTNRTVKTMIVQFIEGHQSAWDELMPEISLAINSSVADSTEKEAPKFDGPYKVVKFISPNIVRLAREGERKRRVANVMQLKPFYREEDGEDEEYHPQEVDETRPARNRETEIIVISDEEMPEPPPEAYVEDCESSEAGEEGADTDTTEPRPEPRSDHADRDPRRRRPHYGERRREAPPRQYRHTLYRGTLRGGAHVPPSFPALPDAGAPSEPEASREEHAVPLPEEAWRGEQMVPSPAERAEVAEPASEGEEMPGGPHSTTGEANASVGHKPVDEAGWLEHQIPSPARSTTEEGEPLPWIEAARSSKAPPRRTPRHRVDRPEPSAASKKTAGAGLCPGNEGGTPRLWQLSSHGELEVDPTSTFPRVSIRFKPGVVTNPRLAGAEDAGGPVREAKATKEEPPGTSLLAEPTEPKEAATVSPTESELLREMEDLLDGWEPELDELLGQVGATLEPLIPRGWRVFPRGTILTAPTIQLLQGEVSRLGGEYRRSRIRVVDGEALYTVTINAAGTVTITLGEKGGGVRRR